MYPGAGEYASDYGMDLYDYIGLLVALWIIHKIWEWWNANRYL